MMYRLINYYCGYEKDIFIKVANDNTISIQDKLMSVKYIAAMLSEANIGTSASIVLNKYLSAFFSRRLMPSEKDIYRGSLDDDKVPPAIVTKNFGDDRKYTFFVKNLSLVIKVMLE